MSGARYLLSNDAPEAMDRFTAFTTLFDPATFRHLDGLGLAPGWRCWEVGAGGSSVVDYLTRRVGPTGQVLATGLNPCCQTRRVDRVNRLTRATGDRCTVTVNHNDHVRAKRTWNHAGLTGSACELARSQPR